MICSGLGLKALVVKNVTYSGVIAVEWISLGSSLNNGTTIQLFDEK